MTALLLALLQVEVGIAAVDITPPDAYFMAGYFHERKNTGVRDPLQAKAVVFRQGAESGALVMCDLVNVHPDLTSQVRKRVVGLKPEHVALAATHTHTGPDYGKDLRDWIGRGAPDDGSYPARLVKGVVDAVAASQRDLAPAAIRTASLPQDVEISFCRRFTMKDGKVKTWSNYRDPNTVKEANPIDPEVALLAFARPGEAPKAAVVNFALHLDTLSGTLYSADFAHDLQQSLREDLGPAFLSVFANGCCGDINHVNPRSEARNKTDFIGQALGATARRGMKALADVAPAPFAVRREVVTAPLQPCTEAELAWAEQVLTQSKPDKMEMVRARKLQFLDRIRKGGRDSLALEVHAFRVGADAAIVTIPGEVFVELGLAIKKGSPFARTLVVELANTNEAKYVPKRDAYALGGYEVENSTLAAGGGELLVDAALRLLKALKEEAK